MKSLSRLAFRYAAVAAAILWSQPARGAKVACVGDSITYGYGLGNPSTESYPAVLGARLGSAHTVGNFGVSGSTLLKNGDRPYWDESAFAASDAFEPDVVVIMLGTNDAKPQNWSHEAEFSPDYLELITHYRSLGALVYIATPPPVYGNPFDIPGAVVESEVVPLVRTLADDAGAPLIEVFTALSGKSNLFPDAVHPNAEGAELIAETVFAALEANGLGGASSAGGTGGGGAGGIAGTGGRSGGAGGTLEAGSAGTPSGAAGGGAGGSGNPGGAGAGGQANQGGLGRSPNGGTTSGGTPATSGASGRAATGGASGDAGATGTSGAGAAGTPGSAGSSALAGRAGAAGSAASDATSETADSESCACRAGRAPRTSPAWLWIALGALAARAARSKTPSVSARARPRDR